MSSDPIADMLTRIRNANQALLPEVAMSHSNMRESIAKILKREGYVSEVAVEGKAATKTIKLKLKYQGRKGVIAGLRRVSTPGLRRYVGATEIPRVLGGMGISILSTPRGVLSGTEARKQNVGGELLAYIW
jgi:small subunit ribosomal protein S8